MQIDVREEAVNDIQSGHIYYEKLVDKELADKFYFAVHERINSLLDKNFDTGSNKYNNSKGLKFVKTSVFPYIIFFKKDVSKKLIVIARVLHEKRDLKKRVSRLR
jgi:plasmid stabilization system protein ParE